MSSTLKIISILNLIEELDPDDKLQIFERLKDTLVKEGLLEKEEQEVEEE